MASRHYHKSVFCNEYNIKMNSHNVLAFDISLYTYANYVEKAPAVNMLAGAFLTLHTCIRREFPASVTEIQHGRGLLSSTRKMKRFLRTIISFRRNSLSSTSRSWWRCNFSRPKLRRCGSQSYLYPPTSVTYCVVNFAPRRDSWHQKFSLAWRVAGVFSTWFV